MYQIVFNEISAAEMARIPKELQLELLAEFQFLPDDLDSLDSKAFGIIEREGNVSIVIEPTITGFTSNAAPKASWCTGFCTKTPFVISFFVRNCQWRKTNSFKSTPASGN